MVLAVGAVFAGMLVGPTGVFEHFIALTPRLGKVEEPSALAVMLGSSLVALAGVFVAWWMYVRQPGFAEQVTRAVGSLYELSRNKLYFDEIYDLLVVKPATGIAVLCRFFDFYILDGFVDLVGHVPRLAGQFFGLLQNGLVQVYGFYMVIGMTAFLIAILRWLGG
jgi:NADH-quinone oxidoreductase subunit L